MTMKLNLPVGDAPSPISFPHFPAKFQAVIWRNWGRIPLERLAKVLFATPKNIRQSAAEMGLPEIPAAPHWLEDGFLTIIRQNWHLLPYEQLLQLLDWTPAKLLNALHEEDFLWIKMGSSKPAAEPVKWRELTPAEIAATAQIRNLTEKYFSAPFLPENAKSPFEFFAESVKKSRPQVAIDAAQNETALDSSWGIEIATPTPLLRIWADDFTQDIREQWGINLSAKGAQRQIVLRIVPQENAPRESHNISVDYDEIIIEGVDERGVLRGLQLLKSTFIARGGALFTPSQIQRRTQFEQRIIHPYNASYNETLAIPNHPIISDDYLARLADCQVNGVWMQAVLYQLQPWPEIAQLNQNWEIRVANLRRLTERAARYGIGIYLYLNEPRALPVEIWEKYPELAAWRGVTHQSAGTASLCTSIPEVRDGLRQSLTNLFSSVPQLAGCFTISMSENLTHCHSKGGGKECPRCRKRAVSNVVTEVNETIAAGVWAGNPNADVIDWTWGWGYGDPYEESPENWSKTALQQLSKNIKIMCTSEEALPTNVGGIAGKVADYTISQSGPSPRSRANWKIARQAGHKTAAKVQINNTWELSAVPYLPVFQLVYRNISRLQKLVQGLLLSWTLGSYPSPNLRMVSTMFWSSDDDDLDSWWLREFGADSAIVRDACAQFSVAFQEFPFHITGVYTAPYNYGPMNLLHAAPTNRRATMIGFPYDDLETWRSVYPQDIYLRQLRLVENGWRKGLEILQNADSESAASRDLSRVARAAWIHFRTTANQAEFIMCRDGAESPRMQEILDDEIALAEEMLTLQRADPRLGYEPSNHYFYHENELIEKILSCHYLKSTF